MSKAPKKATQPHYLDLDAIVPEVSVVIKFGGAEHKMAMPSVEDFVRQTKEMEKLSAAGSPEEEMKLLLGMLGRAFPTIGEANIGKLTIPQLREFAAFAMENANRLMSGDTEGKDGENPPKAGR